MEQHIVTRRLALLAGIGAVVFATVQRAVAHTSDDPIAVSSAIFTIVVEFLALAVSYASLVFKGRLGVVCEVVALLFIMAYVGFFAIGMTYLR